MSTYCHFLDDDIYHLLEMPSHCIHFSSFTTAVLLLAYNIMPQVHLRNTALLPVLSLPIQHTRVCRHLLPSSNKNLPAFPLTSQYTRGWCLAIFNFPAPRSQTSFPPQLSVWGTSDKIWTTNLGMKDQCTNCFMIQAPLIHRFQTVTFFKISFNPDFKFIPECTVQIFQIRTTMNDKRYKWSIWDALDTRVFLKTEWR